MIQTGIEKFSSKNAASYDLIPSCFIKIIPYIHKGCDLYLPTYIGIKINPRNKFSFCYMYLRLFKKGDIPDYRKYGTRRRYTSFTTLTWYQKKDMFFDLQIAYDIETISKLWEILEQCSLDTKYMHLKDSTKSPNLMSIKIQSDLQWLKRAA